MLESFTMHNMSKELMIFSCEKKCTEGLLPCVVGVLLMAGRSTMI